MMHPKKLTRKQQVAVAALLSESSVAAAAAKAGIGKATLDRWLALEDFKRAYRSARSAVLEQCVARLVDATTQAVAALVEALGDDSPSIRVKAAAILIQQAFRGLEVADLSVELQQLRSEMEEIRHGAERGGDPVAGKRTQANGAGHPP